MAGFEDLYIDADGFRTRYWQKGEGEIPLVLLHGLGGTIEDWAGTLAPLAQTRRVIAIDLLGCGETDKPGNTSYSLEIMRNHVVSTLDALGLDRVSLNGWSLGGRIALDITHAEPRRVDRLILTAPAGVGRDTILDLEAPVLDLVRQVATRPGSSGLRIMHNAIRSGGSARLVKFAVRRISLVTDEASRNAFLKQLRSLVGPSGYLQEPRDALLAKLPHIATPTLAVWGRQDVFAPFAHSNILTAMMPQCTLHSIPGCGHVPHIEWPEHYTSAVNGFLG